MNEVFGGRRVQATCQSRGWKFCFISGVALQRWGEPRETVANLSLFAEFGHEEPIIQILLSQFEGRIPDAAGFAKENRVLLLRSSKGVGLDVALAGLPYEELVIERASDFEFPPRIVLRTCSAEDLVVLKAFAARGQDWVDVERIIVRQTGQLNWNYIYDHLRPLVELKDQPEIVSELERRRAEFEQ